MSELDALLRRCYFLKAHQQVNGKIRIFDTLGYPHGVPYHSQNLMSHWLNQEPSSHFSHEDPISSI